MLWAFIFWSQTYLLEEYLSAILKVYLDNECKTLYMCNQSKLMLSIRDCCKLHSHPLLHFWCHYESNTSGMLLLVLHIPGGPQKHRNSQFFSRLCSDALINSYPFSPCWIGHLFLIIITVLTPRSSNLVENFLFYE